ncbi:MAG: oligosaccharide flippase family protein [Pyrinomonadaceae bacterium]|nr:oligosaccharide flippase family protein [Pyrinomonadaceae bacterium]
MEKNERQSASWDLKNAFGNYATLVVSQFAVAFFSFASVTLCTRTLGAEGYGGIVAVIAASSVAQIFVNWTCVGLARFGVEEFVDSGKISKSFWARTIIFLPNTLIFLAFSLLWFPLLANWLKLPNEAFWLVILHFVVSAVWLHVQHAFQGAKLPRLQGSFLAIERVLIFSILGILLLNNNLTWLSAVWAYIFPPFLMTLIGLWQIRNLVSWKFEFDKEIMRKMLKFSVPLIPFSLIGYFSTSYLDAIFISQYLNKTELGIYFVAYQVNGILMQFPVLAGSLLMPLFVTLQSNKQDDLIKKYISDILPLLTLVWGIFCVLTAIGGTIFIPLVFGNEVGFAAEILWVLAVSSAISFPSFVGYIPFINKISATYVGTPMAIAAALTNVIANYFLIPKYGLIGCAWATVLSVSASFLAIFILVHFRHSQKSHWTLQAFLPTIVVCGYYSWTNNLIISLLLGVVIIGLLFAIYRKHWQNGINYLLNYRNFIKG